MQKRIHSSLFITQQCPDFLFFSLIWDLFLRHGVRAEVLRQAAGTPVQEGGEGAEPGEDESEEGPGEGRPGAGAHLRGERHQEEE